MTSSRASTSAGTSRWRDSLTVTIVSSIDPNDKLGVRETLRQITAYGAIPIINENDTHIVIRHQFGDILASQSCYFVEAGNDQPCSAGTQSNKPPVSGAGLALWL